MSLRVWLLFLMTEIAASAVPGPAVLFVISQSLRLRTPRACWAALGIVSANAVWFTLSALGIDAVVSAAGIWFVALRWLGVAYLVYLAIKPLVTRQSHLSELPDGQRAASRWEVSSRAFILQMTNPKALIFFTALLPQFINIRESIAWQALVFGLTSVIAEFPILALYAAMASRMSGLARQPGFGRAIDCAAGALLITAALSIALSGGP